MKHKWLRTVLMVFAMLCVLSGCSELEDDETFYDESVSDNVEEDEVNPSQESNKEFDSNSATQISRSGGKLNIARRTRDTEKKMGEDGWTILLYLCGTDLESENGAATNDMIEAINAEYNNQVHLVIQTGGANEWWNEAVETNKIQRYVNVEGNISLVEELPAANMGDEKTLTSFLEWGIENYPAKNMGLIFWNHGGGSITGVCFDEVHNYDSLSLKEIDRSLNQVYDKMTDRFEFIGFDACLMSTIETANMLVPYARYMYASEETEPGGGWDYEALMNYLAKNPSADGVEFGKIQCESYKKHCTDNGDDEGTTFAITDLSKIDAVITAFDATAKEMYESSKLNLISKQIFLADNFGGNNRSEGYTNMVDLAGLLNNVSEYAPSATKALAVLEDAIVCQVTGPQHKNVGGLSVYYPLSVQGSNELSTFREICTGTYYLAFVDKVAYGTTGESPIDYDNSEITSDMDNIWECDYSFNDEIGTNTGQFEFVDENCPIGVSEAYIDDTGHYAVDVEDFDELYMASCSLFMQDTDGTMIYLGEDDDVIYDYDYGTLTDNFDGSWISLDGVPYPIEIVCQDEDFSIFTCSILLNGEVTSLRIVYDWNTDEWSVIGAWDGIDCETGMASRETIQLKDGDVIEPIYYYTDGEIEDYFTGVEYTVQGKIELSYEILPEADYYYSMSLYDVYGNVWYTDYVTFYVDEEGETYFYSDEFE